MSPDDGRPLTTLEQRIALLVAEGKTNGDVAAATGLSEKNVEWHLARAARKLGVKARSDLAPAVAARRGAGRTGISERAR